MWVLLVTSPEFTDVVGVYSTKDAGAAAAHDVTKRHAPPEWTWDTEMGSASVTRWLHAPSGYVIELVPLTLDAPPRVL